MREVNTDPGNFWDTPVVIRNNFIALADSRAAHKEWLENLEELILGLSWVIQDAEENRWIPERLENVRNKYKERMENL